MSMNEEDYNVWSDTEQAEREMWDAASRTPRAEPTFEYPTDTCVYRRNQKGEWGVIGPLELVQEGQAVTVTTKRGTAKTEMVLGVGEPFEHHGRLYVRGYLAPRAYKPRNSQRGSYRSQEDAAESYNRQYGRAV